MKTFFILFLCCCFQSLPIFTKNAQKKVDAFEDNESSKKMQVLSGAAVIFYYCDLENPDLLASVQTREKHFRDGRKPLVGHDVKQLTQAACTRQIHRERNKSIFICSGIWFGRQYFGEGP